MVHFSFLHLAIGPKGVLMTPIPDLFPVLRWQRYLYLLGSVHVTEGLQAVDADCGYCCLGLHGGLKQHTVPYLIKNEVPFFWCGQTVRVLQFMKHCCMHGDSRRKEAVACCFPAVELQRAQLQIQSA